MAKLTSRKNGMVKLNTVVKRLQKSLLSGKRSSSLYHSYAYEALRDARYVPEDVKEGHFAVIAMDGEEARRFVVPLCYLSHPTFVSLLDQAAEEYGFNHDGALAVPCRPCEFEKIFADE